MRKLQILIIFVLLFNVVHAKNSSNKNTVLHWCNLPYGYVEQSPLRGFNFMKLIPLSQNSKENKGKYFAMVDDEDYDYLMQWNWSVSNQQNKSIYAVKGGYANGKNENKIRMHRLILGITDSEILVDHKDGNGLNNQRSNIRVATRSQNNSNRRPYGVFKYLGVYFNHGKWVGYVTVDRKRIYTDRFENEDDAARARDILAKKMQGEFANLNFK